MCILCFLYVFIVFSLKLTSYIRNETHLMWPDCDKQYHTAQVNPTNKYVFWQTAKIQMKLVTSKIVNEYDQKIPQSQTAENPVAPRGRAAQPPQDTRKTN